MNRMINTGVLGLFILALFGCANTQTTSPLTTQSKTASAETPPAHHAGFNGKHTADSRVLAAGGYISGAVSGS